MQTTTDNGRQATGNGQAPADSRPTCKTCPHWVICTRETGECQRYPPRFDPSSGDYKGVFPETDDSEWCGEHPDMPGWLLAHRPTGDRTTGQSVSGQSPAREPIIFDETRLPAGPTPASPTPASPTPSERDSRGAVIVDLALLSQLEEAARGVCFMDTRQSRDRLYHALRNLQTDGMRTTGTVIVDLAALRELIGSARSMRLLTVMIPESAKAARDRLACAADDMEGQLPA